jgi:hypothetical protein
VVHWLLETHYFPHGRALRRCHPRDLLGQVRNYCVYNDLALEMRPEYFDKVVGSYFTVVSGKSKSPVKTASHPATASMPVAAVSARPEEFHTQPLPAASLTPAKAAPTPAASPLERHVTEPIVAG